MSAMLVDDGASDAALQRHVGAGVLAGAAPTAAATPHRRPHRGLLAVKRTVDVVAAAVLLLLLSPLLLVIAVAILVREGRPIFFCQVRVGQHAQPFTIVKFRSMVHGAHARSAEVQARNQRTGPLFKLDDDPRVTSTGRLLRITSLDELPQLLNVLHGTMSLVGPRPALYSERELFPAHALEREQVPPGITGLWQVKARLHADFESYCEHDLEYVRRWTLRRDLLLLAATPFVVVRHALRRGAIATIATTDRSRTLSLVASVEADGMAS